MIVMSLCVVIPLQSQMNDVIEVQKTQKQETITTGDKKKKQKEKFWVQMFPKMVRRNIPVSRIQALTWAGSTAEASSV